MSPPLERLRLSALDKSERPPMNQTEFDAEFGCRLPPESSSKRFRRRLRQSFLRPCTSSQALISSVCSFIPIIDWLPKYSWRSDLLGDVVGGLTTGIIHVPQGIAYAALAEVDPVYGLYASCFPVFFYMLFGTSKHTSLGSFAVVSLMAGIAAEGIVERKEDSVTSIQAATAVAFSVGVWQVLCGLLRLQFILSYFSTPLVSGFTTGAAFHVLLAQIDHLLGVSVPRNSGPGYAFVRLFRLAQESPNSNPATLLISAVSICFLFCGKQFLTPFLTKKYNLRLPIPYEVLLVGIASALSYFFNWNERFHIRIVGNIPAGVPTPELPPVHLLGDAMLPSLSIAVVTIAVHVSMAKMFAHQFNYKIDTNQELYALGFSSCLGSIFPIYAVSTGLGRTMVSVRSGSRTQLSALFSCLFLLAVILWLGPLLTTLPKCVLASIIAVSLQSLFEKLAEPKALWPISKYDALTWVVAFLATTCIDVIEGLGIALIFTVLTVVMRTQWPHWQYFVPEEEKDDTEADVAMVRFEGPLQFTNGERFKKAVQETLDQWEVPRRPTKLIASPRFLVLDCSPIVYLDSVGVTVLKEVCSDVEKKKIIVYMAGTTESVRRTLNSANFFKIIGMDRFFPTVRDAISMANRNVTACRLLHSQKPDERRSPSPFENSPGPIVRLSDVISPKK